MTECILSKCQNFVPYRRNVYWLDNIKDYPISVARQHPEWKSIASKFHYGHFEVSKDFFVFIYHQIKAKTLD